MQYSLVLNQDALGRRTSYAYDAVGNAVRKVDGRGLVSTMSYDALDRLATQLYASGRLTTFAFDAAGQQTVMADESGVTSYAYDGAGRLSSVAYPQTSGLSYFYDEVGNRIKMAQSNGGLTSYAYDALDRLSVLQNPKGEVTSYVYDALDREKGRVMANGVAMNRGFDADGRTVSLSYATSAGVMRLRHTLTFDKVGNVLSQRELDGALTSFTYDVLDQLTKEERSGSHAYKRVYSYDSAGNRLTLNADGVVTTSTYDAANQIKTAKTAAVVTTFSYDGAGNRALENAAGALTTFTFNQDNKMVEAALPDGTRTTQLYSADGDLRNQTTGTASTLFVRDGQVLLEEWDAVLGTVLRHYTGAPGEWSGLVSLAGTGGANSRFFLFDQLGSTRGLLDELAVLSDEFGYSAYGAELWATGGSSEPLRYAGNGQYQRLFANRMNVGARVYDATTGVWLSIDPFGFDGGDWNLFRYVQNNPANRIDPSGLYRCDCCKNFFAFAYCCDDRCFTTKAPRLKPKRVPSQPKRPLPTPCPPYKTGGKFWQPNDPFKPIPPNPGGDRNKPPSPPGLDPIGLITLQGCKNAALVALSPSVSVKAVLAVCNVLRGVACRDAPDVCLNLPIKQQKEICLSIIAVMCSGS